MRVIIATAARSDLTAIGDYIAVDNPARAATFVDELVDRCEDLATMAERFQLLTPFAAKGIRRRPYKGYLILYRIDSDIVHVVRIVHGARDLEYLQIEDEGSQR
jgi:toxin ParE1/3/4